MPKYLRVTGLPRTAEHGPHVAITHSGRMEDDGTFSGSGIYASVSEAVLVLAALPTAIIEAQPDDAIRAMVLDRLCLAVAALEGVGHA